MVNRRVDIHLDEDLEVSYRPGEERAIEVVILLRGDNVVGYETNSRPWDEGLVQIRNVIATNIDEYSRAEVLGLVSDAVPAREAELRALFD